MTAVAGESPPSSRLKRSAETTKARILAAAEAEFAAKGFDGARLGNIARAAGVQQALIHHYFIDKERLYEDVLARGLAAVTTEGWSILARLSTDAPVGKKKSGRAVVRELTESFVDVLVRFYATHAPLLSIVGHDLEQAEGDRAKPAVAQIVKKSARPVFEAVVLRIEELKKHGFVRADVDPRHLCISTMAMACFPYQEARLLQTLWPIDWRSPEVLETRKREIVLMILARAVP